MWLWLFLELCIFLKYSSLLEYAEPSLITSKISDLICVGPDVNKLEFNVVETDDNVGSIKDFHCQLQSVENTCILLAKYSIFCSLDAL